MKNIHVIPTDKPSRFFNTNEGKYHFREHYVPDTIQTCKNHNIYITSDEEIKEGDWVITPTNDILEWAKVFQPIGKKIILTTHQNLIADGVQPIDDEFLEWFVENPSCETVEIDRDEREVGNHLGGVVTEYGDYKIIIPQEQTTEEVPNELEPVLAKISHQNDLGNPKWYEVVYYVDGKWCSYSGSKTFEDGERVVEWVHCSEIF
jgi:hypothetical protein